MRVLAFDPGAARMGYCCIEGDGSLTPRSLCYGYLGVERASNGSKKEEYQKYRLRLIEFWASEAKHLLEVYKPDQVVNEMVPPVGNGAFASNGMQGQLAAAAIGAVQTVVYQHQLPLNQIAAQTVKTAIGGHKKATKVRVRNGVFLLMPQLSVFKKEWTRMFDVSDAFAIGLTHMGYRSKLSANGNS